MCLERADDDGCMYHRLDCPSRKLLRSAMDPYGKAELISFYDRHLRDFGDHPQAVRWTPEGQRRRFEALLEVAGDIRGKDVLDFGCGKGDLYGFFIEKGISLNYTGLDINRGLIKVARNKYPGIEFLVVDIEETWLDRAFDVIFICGVFNLRIAGIEESLRNILKRLIAICKGELHLNALSSKSAHRNVELFYNEPGELLHFARTELHPDVIMREDIVRGDIFLSVYTGASGACSLIGKSGKKIDGGPPPGITA